MDPQTPASFIPKKPLTTEVRVRGSGLLMMLSIAIFLTSLAAGGATFLYEQYLRTAIAGKAESLQRAEAAYEPGVIRDLVRMDTRIREIRSLMSKHVAPTALFAFLSSVTLESVQFLNFEYSLEQNGSATVVMNGVARDFFSVALQSDAFGASRSLYNIVFSDIAVRSDGSVTFKVSATVDPTLLLYHRTLTQHRPL